MSTAIIKTDEHVFIPGQTGSGKTYLAKKYLSGYENVIYLDTKGTLNFDYHIPLYKELKTLIKKYKGGQAIYRPKFEELDFEYYELFFKFVYEATNIIVMVDEASEICPTAHTIPNHYKGILQRGRERKTAIWTLTQRPSNIPLITLSEATHFFVFHLNLKQDRKRIVEIVGNEKLLSIPEQENSFWYFNTKIPNFEPVYAKLML